MEPVWFVYMLTYLGLIYLDDFLFWTCIERYLQTFGMEYKPIIVFSGFFTFWRLIDYDRRFFR